MLAEYIGKSTFYSKWESATCNEFKCLCGMKVPRFFIMPAPDSFNSLSIVIFER